MDSIITKITNNIRNKIQLLCDNELPCDYDYKPSLFIIDTNCPCVFTNFQLNTQIITLKDFVDISKANKQLQKPVVNNILKKYLRDLLNVNEPISVKKIISFEYRMSPCYLYYNRSDDDNYKIFDKFDQGHLTQQIYGCPDYTHGTELPEYSLGKIPMIILTSIIRKEIGVPDFIKLCGEHLEMTENEYNILRSIVSIHIGRLPGDCKYSPTRACIYFMHYSYMHKSLDECTNNILCNLPMHYFVWTDGCQGIMLRYDTNYFKFTYKYEQVDYDIILDICNKFASNLMCKIYIDSIQKNAFDILIENNGIYYNFIANTFRGNNINGYYLKNKEEYHSNNFHLDHEALTDAFMCMVNDHTRKMPEIKIDYDKYSIIDIDELSRLIDNVK
jgi:hypothetical protein